MIINRKQWSIASWPFPVQSNLLKQTLKPVGTRRKRRLQCGPPVSLPNLNGFFSYIHNLHFTVTPSLWITGHISDGTRFVIKVLNFVVVVVLLPCQWRHICSLPFRCIYFPLQHKVRFFAFLVGRCDSFAPKAMFIRFPVLRVLSTWEFKQRTLMCQWRSLLTFKVHQPNGFSQQVSLFVLGRLSACMALDSRKLVGRLKGN